MRVDVVEEYVGKVSREELFDLVIARQLEKNTTLLSALAPNECRHGTFEEHFCDCNDHGSRYNHKTVQQMPPSDNSPVLL